MSLEKLLIKDRKCGSCSVCCKSLRIEEPELKKFAGVPCQHLKAQGGCPIYNDRPSLCRTWYCGWRVFGIGPEMRPDRCGVLIRFDGKALCFQPVNDGQVTTLLDPEPLRVLSSSIANGMTVQISIPTKEGFCSSNVDVTAAMTEVVKTREFDKIRATMIGLIQFAANSKTDPIAPLN